jgi:hypothetical protein
MRLQFFKSGLWRGMLLVLPLIVLLSLSACGTESPPEWNKLLAHVPSTTPTEFPSASLTTNELVIYLDTSASMAGYVTKDGQSIFGKTLRELRYATGTFGNSDVKVSVRRIASDVGPALTDMELTNASQDQGVYRGGETNLAGAITAFKIPVPGNNKQSTTIKTVASETTDLEPVPRFHILVTDGVQSTKQGSVTHDRTAGSDQFCVRQKIGELLAANWGGCVLGIRADFHGKVYSEVNHSAIPYDTRPSDPTSFRPFYLYIFSPDAHALDSLVNSLKDRLRPLLPQSEPLRELNLSFPYTNGSAEFDAVIPKETKAFIERSKDRGGPPSRLTVRVDVDTEKSGAKPFSIVAKLQWSNHALDTATEPELAQLLSWNVEPIYPQDAERNRKRFPELKILGTHVDAPGQITIEATAGFPAGTEKPSWCGYDLQGRLNLNQASPSWIKEWSIDLDTTREVGNRTFNLETALLGLWNSSMAKNQVVAEAYLRIGPK